LAEFPAVVVADAMVVPAQWFEMGDRGLLGYGPGVFMVEVALTGGHATSGEDTVRIPRLHHPLLGGGGPTAGGDHC
jgi:hypothetical protein